MLISLNDTRSLIGSKITSPTNHVVSSYSRMKGCSIRTVRLSGRTTECMPRLDKRLTRTVAYSRRKSIRQRWWCGSGWHLTENVKLSSCLQMRVLMEISPDLNPLDHFFWNEVEERLKGRSYPSFSSGSNQVEDKVSSPKNGPRSYRPVQV